jgi:hypothetical protein
MGNPFRKLGRNELCWCGSGKKFKKCHLDREALVVPQPWTIDRQLRNRLQNHGCMAPPTMHNACSHTIVESHTVSVGRSLRPIAENGHVLGHKTSVVRLVNDSGKINLAKIGVRQASTFRGFCSAHDKSLFSCFEDKPFTGEPQQCLLMAFRSISRELYFKKSSNATANIMKTLDFGGDLHKQLEVQFLTTAFRESTELGIKDLDYYFRELSSMVENSITDQLSSIILYFDSILPIACGGGATVLRDLNNNEMQNLSNPNKLPEVIVANTICNDGDCALVISWLKNQKSVGQQILRQLKDLPSMTAPSVLLQFLVREYENVFFNPEWYSSRTPPKSQAWACSASDMGAGGAVIRRLRPSRQGRSSRSERCRSRFGVGFGAKRTHCARPTSTSGACCRP